MKIGVSCFQSLERVSLEFEGFTVITGDSNLGKSALIRAASAPVFGIPGDYYVRGGRPSCSVGIRFDPTLALKWMKVPAGSKAPGKETTLDINGVQHTKMGRDQFSLTEPLGFVSIPTSAGELRPQFAFQFDKAFLLDVSDTTVAEVFKALGRGDIVANARDAARRDSAKTKSDLKVRESDYGQQVDVVKKLQWVRAFNSDLAIIVSSLPQIKVLEGARSRLDAWLSAGVPESLPPVPALDYSVEGLLSLLAKIDSYREIEIPSVPALPSETVAFGIIDAIEAYERDVKTTEEQLAYTEKALAAAEEEKKALETQMGVCPFCGGEFGHDH